ncbi:hypothetical protein [Anoxynatronum buryatiense]|uniref:Uncharacterized protein n=1 Tax=Anoxynatronum buryatiense TaxID=489973 RepID=A0AA46AJX7_9CLOT|nr:hypothetical protein [Anoxynatronum buryatiense]SMP64384.1 hypothetical protein SAMN06296020_111136 [Anoxynatronum buryatiense]
MKYKNEKQIMKKLGIENWRNLSKDKVVKFAAMMPEMDKEVMFKVIEQFPEFAKFANGALEHFEESIKNLSESNSKDFSIIVEGLRETQQILKEELQKPEIDSSERKNLIDNLMKVAEILKELDSNNKRFLKGLSTDSLKSVSIVVLAAVVAIGGKVLLSQLTEEEGDNII